jgi:hypothetical protein
MGTGRAIAKKPARGSRATTVRFVLHPEDKTVPPHLPSSAVAASASRLSSFPERRPDKKKMNIYIQVM